ncbi:hypothetical protein [Streptomyces collinus]
MPASQFTTAPELRAFLRLCLDPGPGRDKRTPVRMTEALPAPVITALDELAPPYMRAYRRTAADLSHNAARMSQAYATAVLAWIRDEEPTDELHDLVTAASVHGRECRRCSSGGTLAAHCEEAALLAAAFLAPAAEDRAQHCDGAALTSACPTPAEPADEEPPCAHESWDVTSEYAEGQRWKTWVQSRRCNDCREPLEPIRSATPHFEEHQAEAAAAAVLGHAAVEETAAAYVAAVPEAEQPADDEEAPPAPVLPWLDLLRGGEPGDVLGEIALAMHHGRAPRAEESTNVRHRRTLHLIDTVLGNWRDALDGREPAAYRTPDGRIWTSAGVAEFGRALYENATAPVRYTAKRLHRMYADQGGIAVYVEDAPAAEPQRAPHREGVSLARVASEKTVRELAEIYGEAGHRDRDAQRYAADVLASHARKLAAALRMSNPASVWDAADWLDTYADVLAPAED